MSYFAMPGAATKAFAKQIKPYQTGKSTLQFPFGSMVPSGLITKLVWAKAKENEGRIKKKK